MAGGMSYTAASQAALGEAYREMVRQSSMLSYKNAFAILSIVILMLSPLPFLMRLPAKRTKPAPEDLAGH